MIRRFFTRAFVRFVRWQAYHALLDGQITAQDFERSRRLANRLCPPPGPVLRLISDTPAKTEPNRLLVVEFRELDETPVVRRFLGFAVVWFDADRLTRADPATEAWLYGLTQLRLKKEKR